MSPSQDFTTEARTFTAAITTVCDGRIRIVCDGRACTDGTTIHLPRPRDSKNQAHLQALLGVGCHEAAHVYYDSPRHFQMYVKWHSLGLQSLAAECCNAVLDIADETRFERRFAQAKHYLTASTTLAASEYLAAANADLACQSAIEALVRGIFIVRAARISDPAIRRRIRVFSKQDNLIQGISEILMLAKTTRGTGGPVRRSTEWRHLADLAKSLMRLLDISGLSQVSPTAKCQSRWESTTIENAGGALAKWFRAFMKTTSRTVAVHSANGIDTASMIDLLAGSYIDSNHIFRKVVPFFRRYAHRLLTAPSVTLARATHSGIKLGDVTRLGIDGRVFLRRSEQLDVKSAVAVCLDCSFSMAPILAEAAGIARAFATALKSARGNVACFHFGNESVKVPLMEMGKARLLGSTSTDRVVTAASQWLTMQNEPRRVLAIFTDGGADDLEAAAAAATCAKASRFLQVYFRARQLSASPSRFQALRCLGSTTT